MVVVLHQLFGDGFDAMRPGGRMIVGESASLLSVKYAFAHLNPSIFQKPSKDALKT